MNAAFEISQLKKLANDMYNANLTLLLQRREIVDLLIEASAELHRTAAEDGGSDIAHRIDQFILEIRKDYYVNPPKISRNKNQEGAFADNEAP